MGQELLKVSEPDYPMMINPQVDIEWLIVVEYFRE